MTGGEHNGVEKKFYGNDEDVYLTMRSELLKIAKTTTSR